MSNSVLRAAEILKSMVKGLDRVTDISRDVSYSKATTHRLLNALEKAELVIRDTVERRYYLGSLFWSIASTPTDVHRNLIRASTEDMKALSISTDETICLHIRIGTKRICLEEIPSPQPIKFITGRGSIAPIHIGASGRVLLSQLKEDELERVLHAVETEPTLHYPHHDKEGLKKKLQEARKKGFAMSLGERVRGGAALSAPVSNYIIPVALSIYGPEERVMLRKASFLNELKVVAAKISSKFVVKS